MVGIYKVHLRFLTGWPEVGEVSLVEWLSSEHYFIGGDF